MAFTDLPALAGCYPLGMPLGGGKFDPYATLILGAEGAAGVVVIVAGGTKGGGFSISSTSLDFPKQLPRILRETATKIEQDLALLTGPRARHIQVGHVELTKRCPTCNSPSPKMHPSVQHEGEVQLCSDAWHAAN